jgi:hypothetical protein
MGRIGENPGRQKYSHDPAPEKPRRGAAEREHRDSISRITKVEGTEKCYVLIIKTCDTCPLSCAVKRREKNVVSPIKRVHVVVVLRQKEIIGLRFQQFLTKTKCCQAKL